RRLSVHPRTKKDSGAAEHPPACSAAPEPRATGSHPPGTGSDGADPAFDWRAPDLRVCLCGRFAPYRPPALPGGVACGATENTRGVMPRIGTRKTQLSANGTQSKIYVECSHDERSILRDERWPGTVHSVRWTIVGDLPAREPGSGQAGTPVPAGADGAAGLSGRCILASARTA